MEHHKIGWVISGAKYIFPESNLEIIDTNNITMHWNPNIWKNNFASLRTQIKPASKKLTYAEQLNMRRTYTCPICNITAGSKREMMEHLKTRRHKQEEQEELRALNKRRYHRK